MDTIDFLEILAKNVHHETTAIEPLKVNLLPEVKNAIETANAVRLKSLISNVPYFADPKTVARVYNS